MRPTACKPSDFVAPGFSIDMPVPSAHGDADAFTGWKPVLHILFTG